jgi:hypothetical protein
VHGRNRRPTRRRQKATTHSLPAVRSINLQSEKVGIIGSNFCPAATPPKSERARLPKRNLAPSVRTCEDLDFGCQIRLSSQRQQESAGLTPPIPTSLRPSLRASSSLKLPVSQKPALPLTAERCSEPALFVRKIALPVDQDYATRPCAFPRNIRVQIEALVWK